MSELARLLRGESQKTSQSLNFLLRWIAAVDADVDEREESIIERAFSSTPTSTANALHRIALNPTPDDVALAVKYIQQGLTSQGKQLALELAMTVAIADNRLAVGENHALRFLADQLNFSPRSVQAAYHQLTGQDFPKPRDLSQAATWRASGDSGRQSRRSDHRSENGNEDERRRSDRERSHGSSHAGSGERGERKRSASAQMTAARACEILGVSKEASQDEIKSAYRTLAQRTHPDRFRTLGDDAMATAQAWFTQVQAAYDRLRSRT